MTIFDEQNKSIEDQAAYWLVRLSSSDCSPADRFAFEAWKQEDPAHEAMYLRLQRGNAVVDRHMTDPRIVSMLEEARASGKVQKLAPLHRWMSPAKLAVWVPLAAAVALFAGVLATTIGSNPSIDFVPEEAAEPPAAIVTEVFETSVGERSTITLADSSTITINTNSHVEVTFSATERLLRLTRGQAFFSVEKDVVRPFVVEAGGHRVVALGTEFDVRIGTEDGVEVTLIEGRVTVATASLPSGGADPGANINQPIALDAGERLIVRVNEAAEVVSTDTIEETSWRDGKLVFRARPLASVVQEMNRYSLQRLVLADDPRVQDLKVSGVFNSGGRAASFVRALETLYPLEARRTAEDELTLVWRE